MDEIRFIDLFSGIGGFRLGLERSNQNSGQYRENEQTRGFQRLRSIGNSPDSKREPWKDNASFRCVWSCDNNKYANQVYTQRFGEENHHSGNIRGINPEEIPDFDLLCAGFPCQAFSVAGKRKGFQDTRGTLFFEILRVAEAKRPHLLLLENVKGLLNHDRGRTFTIILQSLDELGYWLEWQVLNSKHFGVPQNRERVFIIGHLRGTGGREIFPIGETDEDTLGTQEETQGTGSWVRDEHNRVSRSLRVGGSGTEENLVAQTISSRYYKDGAENLLAVETAYTKANMKKGRFSEYSHALDGGSSKGILRKSKIRRLTPIECERLQGFPDGWTEGVSDTQRYKCLGNAVTVNVIEFLGHQIRSSLSFLNR